MDLTLSPSEQEFRDEVRTWLEENHPGPEPESGPDDVDLARRREWNRTLADARYAAIAWPEEYGGRGAGIMEQVVFAEEMHRVGAPTTVNVIGLRTSRR